jgi:hypothetical protein
VRCGEADDPIEEERDGRECAGDFEGGLHRGVREPSYARRGLRSRYILME